MDISGLDAAYKLAILATVAFNAKVSWRDIHYEGIGSVAPEDIDYAEEIGYVIKLLAIAKRVPEGLELHVHPALISKDNLLASVNGVMNAIYVKGDMVGGVMFSGPGAGSLPTGSAVVADIVEISRRIVGKEKEKYFPLLQPVKVRKLSEMEYRYYVRMEVPDKPGVLARIAKVFGENNVSIQTVVQRETVGKVAPLVIILHSINEGQIRSALAKISKLRVVNKICSLLRVGIE
jgi:homoserine dehydrogenase